MLRNAHYDAGDEFEDESLLSHPKIMITTKKTCNRRRSLPAPINLPEPPSERCRQMRIHVTEVMGTLFALPLGAPCPFPYSTTHGKVFDCVCGGKGQNLFRLLRHLTMERCRSLNEEVHEFTHLPFDQFLPTFYQLGMQFKQACSIASALFNYLEREYVSVEHDTTLELEWIDILHDFTMGDPDLKEKIIASMKEAASRSLSVDPMVMMCITEQLHSWDPSYLRDIPDVVQRFIPPTEKKGCDFTPNLDSMDFSMDDGEDEDDEMAAQFSNSNSFSSGNDHTIVKNYSFHRNNNSSSSNAAFPFFSGKRDACDDEEEE